jgi:hypothetical protein
MAGELDRPRVYGALWSAMTLQVYASMESTVETRVYVYSHRPGGCLWLYGSTEGYPSLCSHWVFSRCLQCDSRSPVVFFVGLLPCTIKIVASSHIGLPWARRQRRQILVSPFTSRGFITLNPMPSFCPHLHGYGPLPRQFHRISCAHRDSRSLNFVYSTSGAADSGSQRSYQRSHRKFRSLLLRLIKKKNLSGIPQDPATALTLSATPSACAGMLTCLRLGIR